MEKLRAAAEKKANKAWEAKAKHVSSVCLSLTMYSSMQSKTQSRKATKGRADVDMATEEPSSGVQVEGVETRCLLHPQDPLNFLKLCTALRLIIKNTTNDAEIDLADGLIWSYCTEVISVPCPIVPALSLTIISQLYGSHCMKPNHHYATHCSVHPQLWSIKWVLDVSVQMPQQDPQVLQDK